MMGRMGYTFSMMRSSWQVLKMDKELIFFPIFSVICCVIILASFLVPMLYVQSAQEDTAETAAEPTEKTPAEKAVYGGILFLYYFCNYFVIIFFNSAVVACAVHRMRGGDPDIAFGLRAASNRLPQIFGWALVSATVGVALRLLENSRRGVGRFIAGLLGMVWTVLTFLVVPVMVVERKGPVVAFKESAALLKKTWGEQLIGHFAFGIVFFLLAIPGLALVALGIFTATGASLALGVLLLVLGATYLILCGLVQSVLQTVFQAAVYLYAKEGRVAEGFDEASLRGAMHART